MIWQRLAASIVLIAALAGGLAGGLEWRNREEQRRDEAARQQVLKALRITSSRTQPDERATRGSQPRCQE
jgi:hypothetical protein